MEAPGTAAEKPFCYSQPCTEKETGAEEIRCRAQGAIRTDEEVLGGA